MCDRRQPFLTSSLTALRTWLCTLILIAGTGCSAPSLHSIASDAVMVDDLGLAGPWVDAQSGLFVRVQRNAPGTYVVSASAGNGPAPDVRYDFDVSLVELGGKRFADLSVAKAVRPEANEYYGEMVLHPHEFWKVRRRGDILRLWPLDAKVLRTAASLDGTVIAGDNGGTFVLTSDTAALQRYVTEHADEAGLYEQPMVLRRVATARPKHRRADPTL